MKSRLQAADSRRVALCLGLAAAVVPGCLPAAGTEESAAQVAVPDPAARPVPAVEFLLYLGRWDEQDAGWLDLLAEASEVSSAEDGGLDHD